jgi:hypothetical protein
MPDSGYDEYKKSIETSLARNESDHKNIIAQNNTDHSEIKIMLMKVLNDYVPDIIVLKTKVKTLEMAAIIIAPTVLGLVAKAIISWVEK